MKRALESRNSSGTVVCLGCREKLRPNQEGRSISWEVFSRDRGCGKIGWLVGSKVLLRAKLVKQSLDYGFSTRQGWQEYHKRL